MTDSLPPCGWKHTCLATLSSPSPGVCLNSCPLSRWCHPTISSSVVPFSSRLQSFPASFPMSWLFTSGGQSIGASASGLVLSMSQFSSVQLLGPICFFVTPWTAARQASLEFHHQLLELTQTHVHQAGDAIQPSHPIRWSLGGKLKFLLVFINYYW